MNSGIRVILVDGDTRQRAAISHLLMGRGYHVEPYESVDEIAQQMPASGVLLVNDEGDVLDRMIAVMEEHGRWLPVIAFSDGPAANRIVEAVLSGAVGYLPWPCEFSQFEEVLAAAEKAFGAVTSLKLRTAVARSRMVRLTCRERQVLSCVTDGLSNRLIGERLAISPRTVEIHRANMLDKLGAHHTSEAIRIAVEASLSEPALLAA